MRDKNLLLRNVNMRAIKAAWYGALCRWRPLREHWNYHEDTVALADVSVPGSLQVHEIHPVRDYGLEFSEAELRDVLRATAEEMAATRVRFVRGRLRDVTVLGSSGVTVDGRSGRVVGLATASGGVPRNWRVARRLRAIEGDPAAVHVNLLGVRAGHRQFAHFFWDTMAPLMVWLRHWHEPADRVVFLVREDLSPIQRDAFRFLEEDFPGIAFRTLRRDEKIRCATADWFTYRNRRSGVDNTLARDVMREVAGLFLRHYGIVAHADTAPAGPAGRRIYISRNDATLRRVTNEKELVRMLGHYGFGIYVTGRMAFRDQAALFASADAIVAPHGAALAGLMFCRPGTKVLEFFPANFRDDAYCRLSRAMGLNYQYDIGGMGDFWQNFTIDAVALEGAVRSVLGAGERQPPVRSNRPASA